MQLLNKLRATARRRIEDRRLYRSNIDWLFSLYDRTLNRLPRVPFPGRKSACSVAVNGFEGRLYARLGSSDFLVLEELFSRREYDFLFDGRLKDVRRVVDLGANCGYSTVLWLRHFPHAHILAVEPDRDNVKILRRNVQALGGSQRLTLIEACAAGSNRNVFLNRTGGEWEFALSDAPQVGGQTVPALTVSEIIHQALWTDQPIDLLKCDIEGAESEVFANPSAWLQHVKHLVVEIHAPYSAEELTSAVGRIWGSVRSEAVTPPASQQIFYLSRC